MASNIVYIHDLPVHPWKQLCRILDADGRWEELGGICMKYDVTTLTLIGQAFKRDKSPTSELLNKYSEENGTIKHLFLMLARMDHKRAMSVLQRYVDEKYHCLLRSETLTMTSLSYSKKEDISHPNFSEFSVSCNNSTYQWSKLPLHKKILSSTDEKGATSSSISLSKGKYHNNIQENYSDASLESKLNSLNMSKEMSEAVGGKKSSAVHNVNKNCSSKDSLSDNCVSEKIKNVKECSQEPAVIKKHLKQSSLSSDVASLSCHDNSLPDIMRISYNDICKATNDFDETRVIGRGGFGTVYKGKWKGTSVAIKKLVSRESSNKPSQQLVSLKQSLNELNILKCCRFDHILPLYAVSLDGIYPCLIYQLMVNGSLEDRLLCKKKTPPLTWSQRSHIAECVTKGLNYLHTTPKEPFVHGDIKSANILLDANMDAKIGDFGLTRKGPAGDVTHVTVSSVHGTECYLPPEYLRGRTLSPQVDIYSYGIVLLEIATGLRPYDQKRENYKRLVDYVKSFSGHHDCLRDTKAGEEKMMWFGILVCYGLKCSNDDKKKRPSMQEVLDGFEGPKAEILAMDRIRRVSNDKGIPSKSSNLSPFQLQLLYDLKNSNNLSTSCKLPVASQVNKDVSENLVMPEKSKDLMSSSVKSSIVSTESSLTSSSYISSVHNQIETCDPVNDSSKNQLDVDKNYTFDGKAPVPLISLLQVQLSEADSAASIPQSDNSTIDTA